MNNIFSAYHYACKTKADREAVEDLKNDAEILLENAQSIAKNATFGNIGDIKYTLRTDIPNGGFWCDGAIFDNQDLEQVYQMLVEGKLQSLPMAEYDATVTENGSCGFFGLDAENKRFKVPLLNDVYLKAGQEAEVFGAESLPNIRGEFIANVGYSLQGASGAFSEGTLENATSFANSSTNKVKQTYLLDASRVSSTYQDEAKVNPDYVKYRAYIILYTTEKELSLVNWSNELTRLAETLKEELLSFGATTITYWE